MKNILLLIVIFCISSAIAGQEETQIPKVKDETGTLLIMVQGFKNTDGQLLVALYNNRSGLVSSLLIFDISWSSLKKSLVL